ncbi:uncharacterized protein VTP21DRAFT_5431 [Calcarisporiella thermophila]|uniref:uncharacterized protein n=1 Tax=Calcarisporiella thermophila TaxID=911321 RepID=UPI003743E095
MSQDNPSASLLSRNPGGYLPFFRQQLTDSPSNASPSLKPPNSSTSSYLGSLPRKTFIYFTLALIFVGLLTLQAIAYTGRVLWGEREPKHHDSIEESAPAVPTVPRPRWDPSWMKQPTTKSNDRFNRYSCDNMELPEGVRIALWLDRYPDGELTEEERAMIPKGPVLIVPEESHIKLQPEQPLCIRMALPPIAPDASENTDPWRPYFQPIRGKPWDSIMLRAISKVAEVTVPVRQWPGHQLIFAERNQQDTTEALEIHELVDRGGVHVYEAEIKLVDPSSYEIKGIWEFRDARWNYEVAPIAPYNNVPILPAKEFMVQVDEMPMENGETDSLPLENMPLEGEAKNRAGKTKSPSSTDPDVNAPVQEKPNKEVKSAAEENGLVDDIAKVDEGERRVGKSSVVKIEKVEGEANDEAEGTREKEGGEKETEQDEMAEEQEDVDKAEELEDDDENSYEDNDYNENEALDKTTAEEKKQQEAISTKEKHPASSVKNSAYKDHFSLPLCTSADVPGRWLPASLFKDDPKFAPAALDDSDRFWAPYTCRYRKYTYEQFNQCLSKKYPLIHWFGDSNSRRALKKMITYGEWCSDKAEIAANFDKQRACHCEDYQETDWNYTTFNPMLRANKILLPHNLQDGSPTSEIWHYKWDGLTQLNDPKWDQLFIDYPDVSVVKQHVPNVHIEPQYDPDLTSADSKQKLGKRWYLTLAPPQLLIVSLGNWDAAFLPYETFRFELDRLVAFIKQRYLPYGVKIIYRTSQYFCCRVDMTDWQRKFSTLRVDAYDTLARETLEREVNAMVWNVYRMGEQLPLERKQASFDCPSNHVGSDVVEVENQVLMNLLCN